MNKCHIKKYTKMVKFGAACTLLIGALSFTSTVNASSQDVNPSLESTVQLSDAVYYNNGASYKPVYYYYRYHRPYYGYRHYGYGYRHYGYRHYYRRW